MATCARIKTWLAKEKIYWRYGDELVHMGQRRLNEVQQMFSGHHKQRIMFNKVFGFKRFIKAWDWRFHRLPSPSDDYVRFYDDMQHLRRLRGG